MVAIRDVTEPAKLLPVHLEGHQPLAASVRESVIPAGPICIVDFSIAGDETGIVQAIEQRVNRSLDREQLTDLIELANKLKTKTRPRRQQCQDARAHRSPPELRTSQPCR